MLQGLGAMLGAGTVLAAAIIGSNTFNTWRQQKLSERRIDQAERILTATYKVRRGLSRVRSPMMMGHEFAAAEEKLKASGEWEKAYGEQEQSLLAYAQAYYIRLSATHDDQLLLEECQPMARALFGEELEKAIENLNRQFWSVRVYVGAKHRDGSGSDPDLIRKIESTIWEGYPSTEENEIDQIITSQVKIIEDICVPVLRLEVAKKTRAKKSGSSSQHA
ncbi:MAG: hypothetical protein H7236_07955 [Gemmatimonadaceae bacterium]|nr:hypothetical protein [Caulobacter sp.]